MPAGKLDQQRVDLLLGERVAVRLLAGVDALRGRRRERHDPGVGLSQSDAEAGLEMNLDFFLGILNALNCGDVLNEVAYHIRPFEAVAGETDEKLDEIMDYMHEVFRKKQPWKLGDNLQKYLGGFSDTAEYIGKFVNQLKGDDYVAALTRCRDQFNEIEVDRLRVKPIVKITGEFWAQTTEGDGNFNMFNFLQREGAQVLVEPIGTWIMYMIHQVIQKYKDFKGLDEGAVLPPLWRLDKRAKIEVGYRQKVAKLKLAEAIFKSEYHKIVDTLGGVAHHLADQYELQRIGHPFYNSRAGGGEGHLEVAKNIYYSNKDLAHMVLSLKPFGCMPSTQSDGAQSAVVSQLQGHDLPAGRDLGRRRDQRAQPRADGARRGEDRRPRRNSPKCWSGPG